MRITFFIFLFIPFLVMAQEDPRRFTRMSAEDGLSQNTILSLEQDHYGFMWMGTQDGLNRFDGQKFEVFRHDPEDSTSLSHNYAWVVKEGIDGSIWIGTFGGGLNRYDPKLDRFFTYRNDPENPNSIQNDNIFSLAENPKGTLWVGTNNGVAKLDVATDSITRFQVNTPPEGGTGNNYVGTISAGPDGWVWFKSDTGFAKINTVTNELVSVDEANDFGEILDIKWWSDTLVLATERGLKWRLKNDSVFHDLIANDSSEVRVTKLVKGNQGIIWGGSRVGLVEIDLREQKVRTNRYENANPKSVPHDQIMSLAISDDGVIWAGTRDGLAVLARARSGFKLIEQNQNVDNTLAHRIVNAVLEDSKGRIWVGTTEGLSILNNGTYHNFYHEEGNENSLLKDYILSIFEDRDGTIWIGVRGGGVARVSELSLKGNQKLKVERVPDLGNSVLQITQDRTGKIWLATSGAGLIGLNPSDLTLDRYPFTGGPDGPSHPYIFYLYEDSFDNFWVGTAASGLNLFDRETNQFKAFKHDQDRSSSISSNGVLCIHQDSHNQLWIGTGGGLNQLSVALTDNMYSSISEDAAFERFGRKDGLPNDVIYGVEESEDGLLYFSTNEGLVEFAPIGDGKVLRVFDTHDGLQNNEFNMTATFKNKDGLMYFGGIGGASVFHPNDLRSDSVFPSVQITDLSLYADKLEVGKEVHEIQLKTSILESKEVHFAYHNKVITIDYVGLGFVNPDKIKFKHRLVGFSDDWIETDARSATFTNLDPGDYTFEVMAANHAGVWNPNADRLVLTIPPPPWRTWWAYTIYAALFLLMIYLVIRQRIEAATRELKTQARIAADRETFRKESAANFHDEVGNRLTRISLYLNLLKDGLAGNENQLKYAQNIDRNTKELAAGMRDFLWTLDASKGSVIETSQRLEKMVKANLEDASVKVHSSHEFADQGEVILSMEARKTILQIYKEAINNCMKYAQAGTVDLRILIKDQNLEITLSDDGIGFEEGELKGTGYGTGIMKERAEKLGGKLSISSTKYKGTRVTFICPITHLRDAG